MASPGHTFYNMNKFEIVQLLHSNSTAQSQPVIDTRETLRKKRELSWVYQILWGATYTDNFFAKNLFTAATSTCLALH